MFDRFLFYSVTFTKQCYKRIIGIQGKEYRIIQSFSKYYVKSASTAASVFSNSESVPNGGLHYYYYKDYLTKEPSFKTFLKSLVLQKESNFKSLLLLKNLIESPAEAEDIDFQKNLTTCFKEELERFSFEDICTSVGFIAQLQVLGGFPCFLQDLRKILDDALFKKNLSRKQKLLFILFCKHSFGAHYSTCNVFKYLFKAEYKLLVEIKSLNGPEIAVLLYCVRRRKYFKLDLFSLMECLIQVMNDFDADDLGIVALGLLKLDTHYLYENFVNGFISRTEKVIENMNVLPFNYICELFSKTVGKTSVNSVLQFQSNALQHAARLGTRSLIILLYSAIKHKSVSLTLWNYILNDFKNNTDNYDLHNLERIINIQVLCLDKDHELLSLALKRFEAHDNLLSTPRVFVSFLQHLILNEVYPKNLLDLIFSEQFITEFMIDKDKKDIKNSTICCCWWQIFCQTELEKPELCNLKLDNESRQLLFYVYKTKMQERVDPLYKIKNFVEDLYGEESIFIGFCLPHFNKIAVMRFDENLKPMPLPDEFLKLFPRGHPRRPLKDDCKWTAFVVTSDNDYIGDKLKLYHQAQYRQLKIVGFEPVFINRHKFRTEIRSDGLEKFFTKLVQQSLSG